MQDKYKAKSYSKVSAFALVLLCASFAQAYAYETLETNPEVLISSSAAAPLLQNRNVARGSAWLTTVYLATTLDLTQAGLAPLDLDVDPDFDLASTNDLALPSALTKLADKGLAENPALNEKMIDQAQVITASIPAMTAPAGVSISQTIRQEAPLFGAYRIRFGKIKSGARISGLIKKAVASGTPDDICTEKCADLADQLALSGSTVSEQLRHVSASVNRIVAYKADDQNHDRVDYWSTPGEILDRSSGDCEDYAILKMALLARLDVPMSAMEIVVLKDTSRNLFHAVLSVAFENRSLILDNVTDAVEADTAKESYEPLFSISGTANYVFGYKGGKSNLTASLKDLGAIAPGAGF